MASTEEEISVSSFEETEFAGILDLPNELLLEITRYIRAPNDIVSLSSTSKYFRSILGPKNNRFWCDILRRDGSKRVDKYAERSKYFKSAVEFLAGKKNGRCKICLESYPKRGVTDGQATDMAYCDECFEEKFWHLQDFKEEFPEIEIPDSVILEKGLVLYRPLHLITIGSTRCIPRDEAKKIVSEISGTTFEEASSPEFRFRQKFLVKVDALKDMGEQIAFLIKAMKDTYQKSFGMFHVLKSPSQFNQLLEEEMFARLSPSAPPYPDSFLSELPRKVWKWCEDGSIQDLERCLFRILENRLGATDTFGINYVQGSKIVKKWLEEYKYPRTNPTRPNSRLTGRLPCHYCRSDTSTPAQHGADPDLISSTGISRHQAFQTMRFSKWQLAYHIFYRHNRRFAGNWPSIR
ncbi:hypothetical protein ABW19_dt0208318 [Dactylella cylindrospora]|nr:hypothetical protein ABW19_dt0208318 [Dactylella cylindrospora]